MIIVSSIMNIELLVMIIRSSIYDSVRVHYEHSRASYEHERLYYDHARLHYDYQIVNNDYWRENRL